MKNQEIPVAQMIGNEQLIGYCGIYCGKCPALASGKCDGCRIDSVNSAALYKKCKVKPCCEENGFFTCADCTVYASTRGCKKYNPLDLKISSWIGGVNRSGCIEMIKTKGRAEFLVFMEERDWVMLKTRDSFFNRKLGKKVNEK